ncbi:hypothetical protein EYM_05760 [Ignicoccus islandicus DSM 13165]|uniref:Uncharacterized protein n=1 Tax=Ignicoccus islandicus DSM 13165 TaxID=940295 RepID=A0A0U3FAB5_9CREN|nr:hypothetical protein [Ignicoccus islandicus]ALU12617.1 hypothetical protein EYM_05760 [Ignicoccus islandicus DSM 13165]
MGKCPYAKPSFLGVRCEVISNVVNPAKHNCLNDKYVECEIFKKRDEFLGERQGKGTRGGKPDCRRCLFYSELTGRCVKLGVKVEDPTKPPCKGKEFKEATQ